MRPDLSRLTLCMMLLGLPGLVAAADLREDISTLVRNAASSVSSHALHYMKRGRHADLERLFPVLDSARFVEIAKDPHEELRDSYLFESPDAHHNRYKEGNVQIKVEDLISDHVPEMFVGQPVRMLIMGSGGCGRLVALVARLVGKGVKSIHIVLVDPEYSHADSWLPLVESHNRYANACLDFTFFLKKLQEAYPGTQLSSQSLSSIENLDSQGCFDVVCAIDYCDYDPYPRSYCWKTDPDGSRADKRYLAALDLVAAVAHMNYELDKTNTVRLARDALCIVSKEEDILSLTPGTPKSSLVSLRPLSEMVDIDQFDVFYLNAGIDSLLPNLVYFAKTKKLLLINAEILRKIGDVDRMSRTLRLWGIRYRFINDATALEEFRETPETEYLVVDCTEAWYGEEPIPERYRQSNVSIVWMDDKSTNKKVQMSIYPPEKRHLAARRRSFD